MKQLKFKLLLCLLILGIGSAYAQSVKIHHYYSNAYQVSSSHYYVPFSSMTITNVNNSNWGPSRYGTDCKQPNNLTLNGSTQAVYQRQNYGRDAADIFDRFMLTYTAPAYESVDYKVYYWMVINAGVGSSCRVAYYDYGITGYDLWCQVKDPAGYKDLTCAYLDVKTKYRGETNCVHKLSNESAISQTFALNVTVDNNNGTSQKSENRYGAFSSSKTQTSSEIWNTTTLNMWYESTRHYWEHITYYPNGATSSSSSSLQSIKDSGTLRASGLFSRKNHLFYRWNTQSDGKGKEYGAYTPFTVTESNKGTMDLYAIWTPVQFTFKNGDATVGSTLSAQSNGSLPILDATTYKPTSGDKRFVGYFTEADGKGIQVYDGNLQPTTAGNAENFTSNTTLYAYFILDKHNVIFDYSFRTGDHTYATLSDKIYTCRLQFKDASGAVLKTVYLTAPKDTNKETSITDDIATHTTSNMVVNLAVGNGDNVVSGSEATIYFATLAELEKVHSFQYDVWKGTTEAAGKTEHWETETNEGTNSTIFKYTGYHEGNIFTLSWTVTLHNLAMYPEKIYAKPMVKNNEDTFAQISPMTGVTGLECLLKETDGKTYATYTGEYAVLKTQSSGTAEYKVGMTGFYLDGSDYFLNATHGTIPADFVSSATATSESATISYDIYDYDIPVVLLLPAAPGSGITDATVNYAKKILYVDQARATKVNLSNFVAYRENFDFLGWYDTEWKENGKNKIWGANDVYEFHTHDVSHNGGTRTLIAQWTRSTAPVASVAMTEEANQFKYTITATDDVKVTAVKYLISDTEPAANAGWIDVTDNTVTIPRTNDVFGKYLYVMVENEGKNVIVKYNDPIRSFIDIKANPDPDSHDKEVIENGTWEGETFTPDGTTTDVNYYDYYSTFFYRYHTFIAANASVFTAQVNGNHLDLTEIMPSVETGHVVIPQNTAVILCKKHATDGNIVLEERTQSTQVYSNNILEGTDEVKGQDEAGYDYYIFSYAQKGLGFYLNSSDQLAAHKAYFKLPNGQQNARAFTLNFGDSETTAIRDIETEADSNALYDLSGRKVSAPSAQGGIYIMGGKKVFIKK